MRISTPCILHAGGAKGSGSKDGGVHASCWFNAECIASPGRAKRGDGFVDVSCKDRECACSWRYIDDGPEVKVPFTIAAPPESGDCERLLRDRCMSGMSIYDAGAP